MQIILRYSCYKDLIELSPHYTLQINYYVKQRMIFCLEIYCFQSSSVHFITIEFLHISKYYYTTAFQMRKQWYIEV